MESNCKESCSADAVQVCRNANCECKASGRQCMGGDCECPVEQSVKMWESSFCRAMIETQTDILKEKIRKAWGPMMDKTADAVVEKMGIWWQSKLASAKAEVDLRGKIIKHFEDKQK